MRKMHVAGLSVDVVRKDIKNLHLAVYPPDGRVRVAVPLRIGDEALRLALIGRLPWIKKQQRKFRDQDRQSAREFIPRESHYYLGRRYLLNVIEHDGVPRVAVHVKPVIDLFVRPGMHRSDRERILQEWYRRQLKGLIPPLIEKWERTIGIELGSWGVRRMRTRWGTCNAKARRIWLNLELVKKPARCLEYILVHEMVHLLERCHNDTFVALMDKHLPNWQHLREELNRQPLRHEAWKY